MRIDANRIREVRELTCELCKPLAIEDHVVQPADFVSPPKWHLAHTTWFFENFVVARALEGYEPINECFSRLFNSYYKSQGEHWQQGARGNLSRPLLSEVHDYRDRVDAALGELAGDGAIGEIASLIELGLNHEQQHQELLVMDIKAILGANPMMPAYASATEETAEPHPALEAGWVGLETSTVSLGVDAGNGFAFDNEHPRHDVTVHGFVMASGLVTNGGWLNFIEDEGYSRPELWLSDGWDAVVRNRWSAPRYWFRDADAKGAWSFYTLSGAKPIDRNAPVEHVSFYEAEAYARWADARLPTEAEWALAARSEPVTAGFLDAQTLGPRSKPAEHFSGMHGALWQWTASPYVAYPGYAQPKGALGEYNGKFMCNQMVLKGGCHATPRSHYRPSYRNFYRPDDRWQFAGLRIAKDS